MAKRSRVLFKSKELRGTASVAAFLREVADKLEGGEVVLRRGEEEVAIGVADRVSFKVKVKEKRKKRGVKTKFAVRIKWVEGGSGKGEVVVG
jgi:amphi-Trp domain-containing protein